MTMLSLLTMLLLRTVLCFRDKLHSVKREMDGDPMYKTDEALSSLTDFVTDVMIQLCDDADNGQVQTFSNDTG